MFEQKIVAEWRGRAFSGRLNRPPIRSVRAASDRRYSRRKLQLRLF